MLARVKTARAHHRPTKTEISGCGPRKLHFPKIQGDSDRQSLRTVTGEAVESTRNEMVGAGQRRCLGDSVLRSDSTGRYQHLPGKGAVNQKTSSSFCELCYLISGRAMFFTSKSKTLYFVPCLSQKS